MPLSPKVEIVEEVPEDEDLDAVEEENGELDRYKEDVIYILQTMNNKLKDMEQ